MSKAKKKVLVLPAPRSIETIKERLSCDVDIVKGYFENIEFKFNCNLKILHKDTDVADFDFVWLTSLFGTRGMSKAISAYLRFHDTAHTEIDYGEGSSKLVDLTKFSLQGLPIPESFFQKRYKIADKLDTIEKLCGFPLIIKDTKGSMGKNCFLVNSRQEMDELIGKLPKKRDFIFQKFIPNDFDWGILISGGKVVSAERSFRNQNEFRNNAYWGAQEIFENVENVDDRIKNIALRASEILNLEWGRADIIVDKYEGEPYLLEFNRFPGMTKGSTEVSAFSSFLNEKLENLAF